MMMMMMMETDSISFSLNLATDRITDCVLNTARVVDGCLLLLLLCRNERKKIERQESNSFIDSETR
jgi:hypothetical protein